MFRAFRLSVTATLILAPAIVSAHPGQTVEGDVLTGFLHPFSGIDHVLAMTTVGLLAAHLGGRGLWAVPLSFVVVMTLGSISGAAGISLSFVETAIALSVLFFGCAIFLPPTLPVLAAMALVGAFAFFHGHAHGAEAPTGGSLLLYGIGFVAATVLLHGLGITAGLATRLVDETARPRILQACGAVIGLIGVGLTFALV